MPKHAPAWEKRLNQRDDMTKAGITLPLFVAIWCWPSGTERSALDRTSVMKCVERLEGRAAIRLEIDSRDKRVRRLFATPRGLEILEAVDQAVLRAQSRLLKPLGAARAKLFLVMLQEVASANNAVSRVPL
jgi:DNA-binding MarR family transcriptional regulator